MLGIEAISTLLWQVRSIAWECARDGLGDMMVPEAELVFVWVMLDGDIHERHCRGHESQYGKLRFPRIGFEFWEEYTYIYICRKMVSGGPCQTDWATRNQGL